MGLDGFKKILPMTRQVGVCVTLVILSVACGQFVYFLWTAWGQWSLLHLNVARADFFYSSCGPEEDKEFDTSAWKHFFFISHDQDYYSNYIYPREDETNSGNNEEKRSFQEPKNTSHRGSPIKTLIAVLRTTAENVKEIGRYYIRSRLMWWPLARPKVIKLTDDFC